ncbi:MAG: cell division control protein Cdc6 [Candidatus Marsarchaeota archaeon]|jgi:cell division control protein 6|nr:cell division control protein Cdc6 [Candidatus Marsarchaeota archaeon]
MALADLLTESKIFKNRELFSPYFVPKKLIFRDNEIDRIEKSIAPSLNGQRGRNLFIYGKTGSGKTSCVKYVIDEIKNIPNLKVAISYVNCRMYNSRFKVINKVISEYLPTYAKRGYGITDLYEKMTRWIEEDGKIFIIALDELDMVKDLDDLIYTLTRINTELKAGGVSLIGISNKISFKESLDPRSISSLNETELVFSPYYSDELYAILKDRADAGFKENVITDEILRFIAASAAKEGGDARFSLKILTKAAELSEEKKLDRITSDDVEHAIKLAEEDIVYDLILTLPEHLKLVLYSIAILTLSGGSYKPLNTGSEKYLLSGEVYSRYKSLAESIHKEPKTERWYRKYINELKMQGLIISYDSGKGIRGHTRIIKIMYPAKKISDILQKEIFGISK